MKPFLGSKLAFPLTALALALSACGGGGTSTPASAEKIIVETAPAVPDGLNHRLIVGYQGWFGCPGDFEGNISWLHWFFGEPGLQTMTFDALPSVKGLDPKDLCDTGLKRYDGEKIRVFSSQSPGVVMTHFRWMKEQGIDGAAVQRFVGEFSDPVKLRRVDNVLANVRLAAEANERVFYLTYDVSGAPAATVVDTIRKDWIRMVNELQITKSSAYLRDSGRPVIQLWGFGFVDHPGEPAEVAALIADLKNGAAGLPAATVVGGVPSNWRKLSGDSKSNPAWGAVYRSYDVISPWNVGRFTNESGANSYIGGYADPDRWEAARVGIRYQPVVFPGFSWHNLMMVRGQPKMARLNEIPRTCGNFMWRQVYNLLNANSTMMYVAMFDEADEATALFPVESHLVDLPVGSNMIYLDQDGCSLPEDWYLRVTGLAAKFVRTGVVPSASLDELLKP